MEKKEYTQPEVKMVIINERLLDAMSQGEPDGEVGAKQGTFDFDSEEQSLM